MAWSPSDVWGTFVLDSRGERLGNLSFLDRHDVQGPEGVRPVQVDEGVIAPRQNSRHIISKSFGLWMVHHSDGPMPAIVAEVSVATGLIEQEKLVPPARVVEDPLPAPASRRRYLHCLHRRVPLPGGDHAPLEGAEPNQHDIRLGMPFAD